MSLVLATMCLFLPKCRILVKITRQFCSILSLNSPRSQRSHKNAYCRKSIHF